MEVEDKRKDGLAQRIGNSAIVKKLKSIKNIRIIAVVFIIAIALIIYSSVVASRESKTVSQSQRQIVQSDDEQRLSGILSQIDGAGQVQTMITRTDGQIVGVLVIADGAKNPYVRLKLMQASATALGVSEDVISVLCKQN